MAFLEVAPISKNLIRHDNGFCLHQVLAPYDSEDCRGLLKSAIRDPDPVVFLENEILYGSTFPVDEAVLGKDFTLPIGKAKASSGIPHVRLCLLIIPWHC